MIREATVEDLDFMVASGSLMAKEGHYSIYGFNADKTRAVIEHMINAENGFVVVSESDGVLKGWMLASCSEQWFSNDKVAYDLVLYFLPEYRGGSDAFRMVKAYREWAEGQGATEIRIGTTTGVNEDRTARLYEKAGFESFGKIFTRI